MNSTCINTNYIWGQTLGIPWFFTRYSRGLCLVKVWTYENSSSNLVCMYKKLFMGLFALWKYDTKSRLQKEKKRPTSEDIGLLFVSFSETTLQAELNEKRFSEPLHSRVKAFLYQFKFVFYICKKDTYFSGLQLLDR